MRTLLQSPTLITASETFTADILIDGEQIQAIGRALPADGAQVMDCRGMLALPGGVDVHTHFDLPM